MADNTTNVSESVQNDSVATNEAELNTNSDATENANQSAQNDSQSNQSQVDIEQLIQRAVDRATNKLGNENKKLRGQLETLKREHLSEEQMKQLELADKEADIADREARLAEKENRLFAIKAIKEVGLDDGSSNALDLVDFVMSDSEETTTARVKLFSDLVNKMVAAQVKQTFKSNGRNPETGGTGESNTTPNIVETLGKTTAERNAKANDVLKHYLGR